MTVVMLSLISPQINHRRVLTVTGIFVLLAFTLFVSPTMTLVEAKTVTLPLSIDYPLLNALTIQSAFTSPNQTARVFESEDGCTSVIISEPKWREAKGLLQLEVAVDLSAGKAFGENCLLPVAWQGFVTLDQSPKINPNNWQLSFETIASAISDRHHQPVILSGIVTKLMEQWVYPYLGQIHIDLAPPISDLKQTLLPMFPEPRRQQILIALNSMHLGIVQVKPDRVHVNLLIDAEPVDVEAGEPSTQPPSAPTSLSKNELNRFIKAWETWDAFLVHMILALTGRPLNDEEKQILLDTLLDTRHHFSVELAQDGIRNDFVKNQFLWAWKQMTPIFRRHLIEDNATKGLAYLTFFAASDALAAFDALGPAFGIEISREGLIRMARLLGELPPGALSYPLDPDHRLRDILGFDPEKEAPPEKPNDQPSKDPQTAPIDPTLPDNGRNSGHRPWHLLAMFSGPRLVFAAGEPPEISRLEPWIVPKSGLSDYLKRVRSLLKKTADKTVSKNKRLLKYRKIYERIVISTAWQESCFRQFHTKDDKLVYLRSYNGSSVGLMQINERVWRGIYDIKRLRWDIHYNARAGCEVLATYFQRYALKQPEKIKPLTPVQLAGAVYAMYNGGPREFKKFLGRVKSGKYYLSDRLYKEKFTWVVNHQWRPIDQCLVVS